MRAASEWVWARDGCPQRRSRIAMQKNFVEGATAREVTLDRKITYYG